MSVVLSEPGRAFVSGFLMTSGMLRNGVLSALEGGFVSQSSIVVVGNVREKGNGYHGCLSS